MSSNLLFEKVNILKKYYNLFTDSLRRYRGYFYL